MNKQWMIYGANGYTGALTAREAVKRGLQPVLAGRNRDALKKLATELSLPFRVFDLKDPAVVREGLAEIDLVLHCAGPFSATSRPMVEACLSKQAHYLDITGEIDVFAACHQQDEAAKAAGIVVCPGAGFDVVPTDCMAANLARALPDANHLELAFEAGGGASPGTAKTSVEGLAKGGRIRANGEMTRVPLAYATRTIPFAQGGRHGMTIPWGDVYTAFISTKIPNIKVFLSVPPATSKRLRKIRWMQPLFGIALVQRWLKSRINRNVRGPDTEKRESTNSRVWGQVSNAAGKTLSAELETPNGYELTVTASLGIVSKLLDQPAEQQAGGFFTPSMLMGHDYVFQLDGVRWVREPGTE
ncbi:MAG: saccharopine dehydrogenase NADP-binding domain-containing protein [Xanthomonadales bacterium]|nr:saccharopine dehydrogenase NADP-binding domain-containing protein [Xanthomonadales bacterium]